MLSKLQIIILFTSATLLCAVFLLAPTVAPGKKATPVAAIGEDTGSHDHHLDFNRLKQGVMASLTPSQQQYVQQLESGISRGDVRQQSITAYKALASFFKDSVLNPPLHYHYLAQSALLEGKEKSLTFAAHSILGYLPYAHNAQEQHWLANVGKELFEKAKQMNSSNDSTVVGLAGTYIYGADAGGPNAVMEGIMQVRDVATRDSTNVFAQYMLGVGGVMSGQYDKAAERFERVLAAQPNNLEVMFKLSEAYELANQPAKAVQWYKTISSKIDNRQMLEEIEKRIAQLQQSPKPVTTD